MSSAMMPAFFIFSVFFFFCFCFFLRALTVRCCWSGQNLFGRRIAIDASMALYSFLIAVRTTEGVNLTDEFGETTSHLQGMWQRTIRLLEHGVKVRIGVMCCLFVFLSVCLYVCLFACDFSAGSLADVLSLVSGCLAACLRL